MDLSGESSSWKALPSWMGRLVRILASQGLQGQKQETGSKIKFEILMRLCPRGGVVFSVQLNCISDSCSVTWD